MSEKKYTLIGRQLSDPEVDKFPSQQRFSSFVLTDRVDEFEEQFLKALGGFGYLLAQSNVKCPVGPHDEPWLAIRVARACGMGPSRSVAVQCSQGHWAEYPCS